MAIILRLDRIMADRKMSLKELAENVGISYVNLSKIKTGKVQGVRFSTLESICETLDCQPGDILEYVREERTEEKKERSRHPSGTVVFSNSEWRDALPFWGGCFRRRPTA